jgi:hypothetical protein
MNLERVRMHVGLDSLNIEISGLLQISHMRDQAINNKTHRPHPVMSGSQMTIKE